MIKIIREGTRKKCECKECGCYFSYEDEDVIEQGSNLYSMGEFVSHLPGYTKVITCPQCETVIVLEEVNSKDFIPRE